MEEECECRVGYTGFHCEVVLATPPPTSPPLPGGPIPTPPSPNVVPALQGGERAKPQQHIKII